MIEFIRRLTSPPKFDSDEANQRASILNGFNLVLLPLLIVSTILYFITGFAGETMFILLGLIFTTLLSEVLLKLRKLTLSGVILIIASWILVTYQAYTSDGIRDVIILGYIALTFLSILFLNWRSAVMVIVASIAAIWFIAYAEISGDIVPSVDSPLLYARDVSIIIVIIAMLVYFVTRNLRDSLESAQSATRALEKSNTELETLRKGLEAQVQERTLEMTRTAERYEERARKYESIALVAKNIASIDNIPQLMASLASTIHYQLGYYHIGVYLLDENHAFLDLQASNSIGGEVMMIRGHRLPVGEGSIVGEVAATGRTRIAFDSGEDAFTFNYEDLPKTRSEIVLPLRSGEMVVGVLDVHSEHPEEFSATDVEILTTLSGQVAAAIYNAQLLEKARQEKENAEAAYKQYVRQEWQQFVGKLDIAGYQFNMNRVEPITDTAPGNKGSGPGEITVPVTLRGETLGEISIENHGQPWSNDDYALIRAAAERAALGLENARLINTTRQRAQIERTIADISATIGSSTDFDGIMQSTVEELGKIVNAPEIFIRIRDTHSSRDVS